METEKSLYITKPRNIIANRFCQSLGPVVISRSHCTITGTKKYRSLFLGLHVRYSELVMIEVPLYRNTAILNVPLTNDKSRSVFTTITQKAEEVVGGGPVADPGEAPPPYF